MKTKFNRMLSCALTVVLLMSIISHSGFIAEALNKNKENIFFFLKNNMGMSTASACGVMANIEKESSFNPNATGDGGTSYGICQWHNDRWDKLKSYCTENGYDWQTLTGQLYYLKYEFEKYYPNTLKLIKDVENSADGAYAAADAFCRYYEKPANLEYNCEYRGNRAKNTYFKTYGFSDKIKKSTLSLDSEFTSVSSKENFRFTWKTSKCTFDKYTLTIVKCIDETAEYMWSDMKQYTVAASKKAYTVSPATLSAGNYLAFIRAHNSEAGEKSDYSNFLFFSVYDEMIYDNTGITEGATYDFNAAEEIKATGWAVNTGKKQVSFSYQLDDGEIVELPSVTRDDIFAEQSAFAVDNKLGYELTLPLSDVSNGKHTLSVYASSETMNGLLWQVSFSVINSHDHVFKQYTYNNDESYTANGTKTAKCELCNATHTVEQKSTRLILGTPASLRASFGTSTVTLKWKAVKGATGYRVYRYSKGWKLIGKTAETTFKATGLSSGKDYSFAVKAYAEDENTMKQAPDFSKLKVRTKPQPPKTFKATQTTTSVTLSWSKSTGATGYRIYRYNSSKKKWETLKTTTSRKFTVKNLKSGSKQIYGIRAYYDKGDDRYWSERKKITTATKPATPTLSLASTAKGRATMKWKNVVGENGYQVWYSTSKNGTYKKASNFKANSVKGYKKGLKSGKTYYFKVRAYKTAGGKYIYSSFSSAAALKIK